ncbi:hypothetical protein DL764_006344 [Monosporascus ibericus]|uniref:Carrier domain-containing protein n=1 Tax=Monosporascus ibericus TaxID=155417 RepID=A0A4Q4T8Q0_9PEZI|nr:hypothetical protein DL764_006344 [Monosporascus ibericus]
MTQIPPAEVGQRLLPSLVDEIALSDPDRVLYSIAKTKNVADGFHDISAKAFARAVDRCAWYINKNLGSGRDFPTLTYIGPQDAVYAILILACVKTGYKLLLNSPRLTLEVHLSLFEKTGCNTFLLPPNFSLPVIKQILAARQMRVLELPGMQHWIEVDEPVEPYAYSKPFLEAKSDPFVVLHTSGSTGMPKPIIQTHGTIAPLDAFTALASLGQQSTYPAMCAGTRVYLAFPLFHCAGVSMLLPGSIYSGFTVVLGPFPPSADVANAIHIHGNVQHSCLAPVTLIELVKDQQHLENLGRLKQITFGGGPCPQAVGDLISTKTRLLNCLGTTECGVLPIQLCDPEDWAYMRVSPMLGHEYRYVSEGLYEQVIIRKPELRLYQGIFETFLDLQEWPMKDLYSKHQTQDAWLYRGRADDIIVFSTGEKLNPLEMESILNANPAVNGALVAGVGRFQSCLLVEAVKPPIDDAEKEALLEVIWPSVQAANKTSPSYGRIHRNMVTFTSVDKPMLRAGKGTVQRQPTVDLYAAELEALYKGNELSVDGSADGGLQVHCSIEETVKHIIATSTDIDVNGLAPDADLFEQGLDSLQVTLIARKLKQFLQGHSGSQALGSRDVYSNPTIVALTTVVSELIEGKTREQGTEYDKQKMQTLYNLHAANMPISARKAEKPAGGLVILLTGSTGSLGSYTLDSLLKDTRTSRVYCLNRGPRSLERQKKSQATKGLQPLPEKVRCLDADLSSPYFGLPLGGYKQLLDEVTHVIHNAWKVDFNQSIDSFASYVGSVRKFIDFSAYSRYGAQLFFISSISAVANLGAVRKPPQTVPEEAYDDWSIPEATGYGESKFVAERLLNAAAREADIPAIICRVGQVAGPTTTAGEWPRQEWLPSLIASSNYIGKLPVSLGQMETVDWIPVDILAQCILELATNPTYEPGAGAAVCHTVNPKHAAWADLLPAIIRCLNLGKVFEMVSLEEWVDALRESASKTEDVDKNPAIKILDFYSKLINKSANPILLDTKKAASLSKTLVRLGPIQEAWIENWMRQWAF